MSVETVREFFKQKNKDIQILTFEDTSTVEKAANALGVTPGEIAKSLLLQKQENFIMILMAGDKKLDNRKFKDIFKVKPKMPTYDQVQEVTGHPVGGVCPFGINSGIEIYLDQSLKAYHTVYPAAGAPNAALSITVEELAGMIDGSWVDVAKDESLLGVVTETSGSHSPQQDNKEIAEILKVALSLGLPVELKSKGSGKTKVVPVEISEVNSENKNNQGILTVYQESKVMNYLLEDIELVEII